jgi:hypothetical protein
MNQPKKIFEVELEENVIHYVVAYNLRDVSNYFYTGLKTVKSIAEFDGVYTDLTLGGQILFNKETNQYER